MPHRLPHFAVKAILLAILITITTLPTTTIAVRRVIVRERASNGTAVAQPLTRNNNARSSDASPNPSAPVFQQCLEHDDCPQIGIEQDTTKKGKVTRVNLCIDNVCQIRFAPGAYCSHHSDCALHAFYQLETTRRNIRNTGGLYEAGYFSEYPEDIENFCDKKYCTLSSICANGTAAASTENGDFKCCRGAEKDWTCKVLGTRVDVCSEDYKCEFESEGSQKTVCKQKETGWFGIVITLIGAATLNIGLNLQKMALRRRLEKEHRRREKNLKRKEKETRIKLFSILRADKKARLEDGAYDGEESERSSIHGSFISSISSFFRRSPRPNQQRKQHHDHLQHLHHRAVSSPLHQEIVTSPLHRSPSPQSSKRARFSPSTKPSPPSTTGNTSTAPTTDLSSVTSNTSLSTSASCISINSSLTYELIEEQGRTSSPDSIHHGTRPRSRSGMRKSTSAPMLTQQDDQLPLTITTQHLLPLQHDPTPAPNSASPFLTPATDDPAPLLPKAPVKGVLKHTSRYANSDVYDPTEQALPGKDELKMRMEQSKTLTHKLRFKELIRTPIWVLGFLVFVLGNVLDFVALKYAPQSLVAPLGSMSLVTNVIVAPWMNKEHRSWKDFLGVLIIVAGAVVVVVFSGVPAKDYELCVLLALFRRVPTIVFLSVTGVLIVGIYLFIKVTEKNLEKPTTQDIIAIDIAKTEKIVRRLSAKSGITQPLPVITPSHIEPVMTSSRVGVSMIQTSNLHASAPRHSKSTESILDLYGANDSLSIQKSGHLQSSSIEDANHSLSQQEAHHSLGHQEQQQQQQDEFNPNKWTFGDSLFSHEDNPWLAEPAHDHVLAGGSKNENTQTPTSAAPLLTPSEHHHPYPVIPDPWEPFDKAELIQPSPSGTLLRKQQKREKLPTGLQRFYGWWDNFHIIPVFKKPIPLSSSIVRWCLPFAYAALGGLMATITVLFAKSSVHLLDLTIVEGNNQFKSIESFLIAGVTVLTALNQIYWINMGLQRYDALLQIPVFYVVWTLFDVIGGGVYFDEFAHFSDLQMAMFCGGVFIIFIGVAILSDRLKKIHDKDQTEEASK